jgi:hypothetical protein
MTSFAVNASLQIEMIGKNQSLTIETPRREQVYNRLSLGLESFPFACLYWFSNRLKPIFCFQHQEQPKYQVPHDGKTRNRFLWYVKWAWQHILILEAIKIEIPNSK